MSPTPLSEWADANGVARRTAYNWAKSGKLNVPLRRTVTGRILVLDDDEPAALPEHPFAEAYAEALSVPLADRTADHDHSVFLEAWGQSLYDAVAPGLRPAVLQLAMAAAARRPKRDVPVRFADWIGRIELADWYQACGMPEAASMVRERPVIKDPDTFLRYWPTGAHSHQWRTSLDRLVDGLLQEAGRASRRGDGGAADYLTQNTTLGKERVNIAAYRSRFHRAVDAVGSELPAGTPIPDKGELWDLHCLYLDPTWAYTRPVIHQMAEAACEIAGWDPATPAPPDSHPLMEFGRTACLDAARAAIAPLEHASLVREMSAFRRVAYGQPFAD